MKFATLDWIVLGGLCLFLLAFAVYAKSLSRSVSDFLAANRCAGRYLLTLADGMAAFGVVSLVANFEKFYAAGFGAFWWGMMLGPLGTIAALSGWVAYRYRETRALTMAEFFERRYSRKFRIFSGSLCLVSGLLNYGIFPMVTANMLVHLFGFPDVFPIFGFDFPTRAAIMIVLLSVAMVLALSGGLITVMITDFIQSQVLFVALLVVAGVVVFRFDWPTLAAGLTAAPPGHSMINPFDQKALDSFNLFFFAVVGFKIFYNYLGWQSGQGYFAAAKSPHEFRMSRILGEWRGAVLYLTLLLVPIAAYVFLHHPSFASEAQVVHSAIATITDEQIRSQMTVPSVLFYLLPTGALGLFAAAMVFASIATDDTAMHSWASIFVQDVLMPLHGKPFPPKTHIRILRWSVFGVAVFAFTWSMVFPLKDYIIMYLLATGTIYLGGSGAVIIGGLYWRRATTAGAWGAMTTGATIGVVAVLAQGFWSQLTFFHQWMPKFPLNGMQIALSAYISSIIVFVTVSLLTSKEPFNLERLLHRGAYADDKDIAAAPKTDLEDAAVPAWQRRFGINRHFTRGDKAIYFLQILWTLFWFTAFLVGTFASLSLGLSLPLWLGWWKFVLGISLAVAVITVVWFMIGGIRDYLDLVHLLKNEKPDASDDGWVQEKQEG
ncbi:MAG: sodium:solute symporter family protein [Terrimicrobiaceae bacterium]